MGSVGVGEECGYGGGNGKATAVGRARGGVRRRGRVREVVIGGEGRET